MNKALINGLFDSVMVPAVGGTYATTPPTAFVSADTKYSGITGTKVYDNKHPLNIITEEIYD